MKTAIRKATDPDFDADTIHATLPNGAQMDVYVFVARDGTPLVQIDTPADWGRLRVAINDGYVWDADPERDVDVIEDGGTFVNV